jgi:AraC family ethanolamine operon transcriptional activator
MSGPSARRHDRPWHVHVDADDVDMQASSQADWSLRYEQLSAGAFHGSIEHIDLGGLRIVREWSNRALRQRGQLGEGSYGFAVPLGEGDVALLNGQRVEGGSLMVGRGDDLDLCTPADFGLVGVVVGSELLSSLWQSLFAGPPAPWLERQVVVRDEPACAALRSVLVQAFETIRCCPRLMDDRSSVSRLRDAIVLECLESVPGQIDLAQLKSAAARRRVVDRACQFILAEPSEPASLLDVCRNIGASRRKLNYCFQDVLGSSPARYLRALRLNSVRRDLKSPADRRVGVQDIAARWGFWHLSQFATDYKRQFCELPSQTLAKARCALQH